MRSFVDLDVKEIIAGQLDNAEDRFAVILDDQVVSDPRDEFGRSCFPHVKPPPGFWNAFHSERVVVHQ
jgi:hypothetical protein